MLFNIPQFLEKEDKIVGPLTAKQLGWFFAAGAVLLVLWNMLDITAFIIAAVIVLGIAGAFAFYQPNGIPLISFIIYSVSFLFRPKMYIWHRLPEEIRTIKRQPSKNEIRKKERVLTQNKIKEIATALDKQRSI
jgi:hypothetical protein